MIAENHSPARGGLRVKGSKLLLVIAGGGIIGLIISSVFGHLLVPFDPISVNLPELHPPNSHYLFGTDQVGRDIFSRVVTGSKISLSIAVAVIAMALGIGVPVGAIAAMAGGWTDELLMRLTDFFFSFPYMILAMAIVATLGASTSNLIVALGTIWWPSYARMIRSQVLSIKERPYVEAAYVVGNSALGVALKHILPQTFQELSVRVSLDIGNVILIATGLSFLGLGTQPPTPEWGAMLGEARTYILSGWWLSFFPGIVVVLAVLSFSLFGDALQDMLSPQQSS